MLTIKTDITNPKWLSYILEQFKKINLVSFDIEVININQDGIYKNTIFYTQKYQKNNLHIFNSNMTEPNGNIEYLKNDLYILENTKDDSFEFSYDIFWNAFVFLSRYEEYISEKNGKNIYSYSLNHPRVNKNSFDIPIVNILFNELENFLKMNFPNLYFKDLQKPIIDLSHDVDYINKTIQLRLKQTAFNSFNTIKSITKPKQFFKNLVKTFKFAFSNPSYWCFDYWEKLEQKYNKTSTFYIYVKNGSKNFKSWLIDPSYDIKTNTKLQNKLKELYSKGFQIGLHGSFNSAKDFKKLKVEKEILEQILGIKITKTRQHWLNYFELITPRSHSKLFEYDSTLGWNDRIGFRSGCASLYNPYDFENEKAYSYQVIPQIVMDSNIYDYADDEEIFQKAKDMIKTSKEVSKTLHISISWHQRVCSSDYNWHKFYEEILNDI
ncbi:DUF7033 domain-containing protein [Aliarcobacter cryaerophilus]|uniref:DUF7033 domain-containing protein n=1 Tax=Aliarcobacter cryaerophilus TaxID=28198 RepID=UPI001654886E|nr:hypothetical protein [Aliarcobacter cryaerophilus]QNM91539.1 hypothetical protein HOO33_06480 [Aliarcobacter cryaerophilus]